MSRGWEVDRRTFLVADAALALGIAHVLVEEDPVDRNEELFPHDAEQGVMAAPKRSLALEGLHPTLEGRFELTLADGEKVHARTVYSLLRERPADYTPEAASKACGAPPAANRDLTLRIGRAKAASMVTGRSAASR